MLQPNTVNPYFLKIALTLSLSVIRSIFSFCISSWSIEDCDNTADEANVEHTVTVLEPSCPLNEEQMRTLKREVQLKYSIKV